MLSQRKIEKLMDRINHLILTLSEKEARLRRAIGRMREEEKYYMHLCKTAYLNKEKLRVETYLCHIAGIKWAIRLFERVEARVIGLKIRLITCQRIVRTWMNIGPDIEKIRKDAGPVLNAFPWLRSALDDVCYEIDAFLKATQFEVDKMPKEPLVGQNIPEELLREVMEEVKGEIEEALPSPPKELLPEPIRGGEPLLISLEEGPQASPTSIEELAHEVMDYARRNGRRLNVRRCAEELGVSEEDVRAALKWLSERGMAKIRGAGYGVREGS